MSPSRVTGTWVCVSIIAGMTVLPARSTRAAPAGTCTSPALPTWVKRPLSTMNAAFSMGALSSPTMSRAPSNTVTPVAAGACSGAGAEQAAPNNEPINKRPATRTTRHDSVFIRRIEPPAKLPAQIAPSIHPQATFMAIRFGIPRC